MHLSCSCSVAALSARAAAGEFRTVEVESLKIEIDSEWAVRTAPGYLPVRFDITNLGEARVIEIVGQGTRFFTSVAGACRPAASTSGRPCGWREAIGCG